MKVLVDTPIWSAALRKKPGSLRNEVDELTRLIKLGAALLIGPIRQEVLSGYSDSSRFRELRDKLQAFPNLKIEDSDYVLAAEFSNMCRVKGIQGSHTDFLICAVAVSNKVSIFTDDGDFKLYAKHLPVHLHVARKAE